MQTLIILGRQPALGLAELESLYGADNLRPVGAEAVLLNIDPVRINFGRLGGMVKFAKVLTTVDSVSWDDVDKFLKEVIAVHLANLPQGKLRLGFSAYGLDVSPKKMQATGLSLKKIVRTSGRSARYIPNVEPALNTAQVLYNQLTQKLGWELLFVRDGPRTIVAQSIAVQDIDAYRQRDQERPMRDPRVGMLPPKLAQIIINLAVGDRRLKIGNEAKQLPTPNSQLHKTILDPFCGTGVILQESQLMGYGAYGTDLAPRMVEYTTKNLKWLHQKMKTRSAFCCHCEVADALEYQWPHNFGTIATETYLGRPLTSPPDARTLQKIMSDVDTIHKKFLQNVARQTATGFRLCIAVPAWNTKSGFRHLPTLDKLHDLGYNRIKFVHAGQEDLIYHREGQTVARELVILERV